MGIYWRRRLVLLAVVLLATAGAAKLVGGGDEPDASASSASTPTDDPPAGDGTTGGESGDDKAGDNNDDRKDGQRPSRDEPEVSSGEDDVRLRMGSAQRCDPGQVTVTPSVPPDTYAGGEVALRLGFSTGAGPCVLSLADETPLISVSAEGETVWTSRRCTDLFEADEVRVEPDWTTYADARWSGRVSGEDCGENATFAEPGDYAVQAALLGGEPASATITLAKEPEEDKDSDGDEGKGSDSDGKGDGDEQNADDAAEPGDEHNADDSGDGAEQGDEQQTPDPDRGDPGGADERDGDQRDR